MANLKVWQALERLDQVAAQVKAGTWVQPVYFCVQAKEPPARIGDELCAPFFPKLGGWLGEGKTVHIEPTEVMGKFDAVLEQIRKLKL